MSAADVVTALERVDPDAIAAMSTEDALRELALLTDANRLLGQIRSLTEQAVAEQMGPGIYTVEGVGSFERHGRKNRKTWDREALLRDVLDTRLVDEATGEVTDPTPLDKVLHVWNLGAPRVTALRARGLDPDEYCASEWGGWSIEVIG